MRCWRSATGAALVPMTSEPLPDGRCRVEIHPPLEIPEGATDQEIAQRRGIFLSSLIREKPELWMWVYKHWRFKPKGATHAYPFYANEIGEIPEAAEEGARSERGPALTKGPRLRFFVGLHSL